MGLNFPTGKKKVGPDNLRSTGRVIVSPGAEGELVTGLGLSLCSGSQATVFLPSVSALHPLQPHCFDFSLPFLKVKGDQSASGDSSKYLKPPQAEAFYQGTLENVACGCSTICHALSSSRVPFLQALRRM